MCKKTQGRCESKSSQLILHTFASEGADVRRKGGGIHTMQVFRTSMMGGVFLSAGPEWSFSDPSCSGAYPLPNVDAVASRTLISLVEEERR